MMALENSTVPVPAPALTALQRSLSTILNDLSRLSSLLDHASENLLEKFDAANTALSMDPDQHRPELMFAKVALQQAVTELQFHDMASQLIDHANKTLQGSLTELEPLCELLPQSTTPPPSDQTHPVQQSRMHAGSIDLF